MADWELPGLAIAVVKDDSVIYARGFGVTELGGSEPVNEQTMFAIASTTKAFTAAALGMLVDQGLIDWDNPVGTHMPRFEVEDPYISREVTIRDLLIHRTGLARYNTLWIASPFGRDEIVGRLQYLPQTAGFRDGYRYNNLMYIVAGELVEAVSDSTWDDFLETRIFGPLGMTRTTSRSAEVDASTNVTSSHTRVNGEVHGVHRRNYDALGGAGAVFSTVQDMAQWVRLHLGRGVYNGRRLLQASTVAELHEPQVVIEVDSSDLALFPDRHFAAYGLGWRLHDYRGRKVVQHTGWVNYTRTQVGMIPSEGIGMVAFSNSSSSSLHTALMYRVFDALLELPETDWSARLLERASSDEDASEPHRVENTRPSLDQTHYAGTYSDPLFGEMEITLADGRLVLSYSEEYVGDLEHWHYDTFRVIWRPAGFGSTFATFALDRRGEVDTLEVAGFRRFTREP